MNFQSEPERVTFREQISKLADAYIRDALDAEDEQATLLDRVHDFAKYLECQLTILP